MLVVGRHPRVVEDLLRRQTRGRVGNEHLRNEVLGRRRDAVPHGVVEVVVGGLDLLEQALLVVVGKGRVAREQDEENDAQRPDVGLEAVRLAGENLGSDVAGRAA